MTPTQFHSEYEIVKWLAGHDNFDQGLAELREALAGGTIVNGRGLVQKWLSVYDDVTTGRAVGSGGPSRAAESAPPDAKKSGDPTRFAESLAAERTLLQRTVQEARLWAEASQEAAARADARSALIEPESAFEDRGHRVSLVLAIVALLLVLLLAFLLWPQIHARVLTLGQFLSRSLPS